MADGRQFKNRLIAISLQPFDRFWWNLARWRILAPYSGKTIKISNFLKFKMAAATIGKSQKLRYLRNRLTDLYEIWYTDAKWVSTAATFKKNSNFTNPRWRYIILSQQPFDRFLLNLARWCMLFPRAWRKFQIINFRQSYTADRRYLANRKTV